MQARPAARRIPSLREFPRRPVAANRPKEDHNCAAGPPEEHAAEVTTDPENRATGREKSLPHALGKDSRASS